MLHVTCFGQFAYDDFMLFLTLSIFPCSGNTHDDTLLGKIETVYTGSGEHGSSMVSYQLNSVLQFKCKCFLSLLAWFCSLSLTWNKDFLFCLIGYPSLG